MSREINKNKLDVLQFVHITDTHILDIPDETFHSVNTKRSFESVLSDSLMRYPDIDFILITGDVSQTGSKESYTVFKSIIQQYDLPIYCVPGNHDTPKLLQQVIPNCPDETVNIIGLGKFSLVLINSWVKNQHYGKISQQCLRQLEKYLENNQDQFNIFAIHHPPILINSKWLDELGLENKREFLEIINKYSQDTLLLFGHIHQEVDQQKDQIRFLSTPSSCHQFKANSEVMHCVNKPPPAYRYIQLNTTNNPTLNLGDKVFTKIHYT